MANIRTLKDIKKNDPPGGGRGPPGGGGGGGGRGMPAVTDPKNVKLVHSEAEFNNYMRNAKGLVVVDWSASWCGPCKMIYPYYVELSVQYKDVLFLKIDVDELKQLADRNNVTAMPTFQFFRNLEMVHEIRGANPNILQEKVKEYRAAGGASGGVPASGGSGSGHSWGSGYSLSGNGPPAAEAGGAGEKLTLGGGNTGGVAPLEVFVDSLVSMGFPLEKAKKAVVATKNSTLDAAIDWIVAQPEDMEVDEGAGADDAPSEAAAAEAAPGAAAESSTPADPMVVDAPLTEEEKRQKADEMKAKLDAIREQKKKEAEARDLEIEKSRIKNAEAAMRSKRANEEERQKLEAAREKAKKLKEKQYKAEVRARVQAAKEARLKENARRRGEVVSDAPSPSAPSAAPPHKKVARESGTTKSYTECAVAVRTPRNGTLEHVFAPSDTMQDLYNWVTEQMGHANFSLQTNYPRKTYGPADMGTTLKQAGLVPRGALTLR